MIISTTALKAELNSSIAAAMNIAVMNKTATTDTTLITTATILSTHNPGSFGSVVGTTLSGVNETITQACNSDQEIIEQIALVERYFSTVVITFGILGNILTLLTLRNPSLKEAPYTYLRALAVADLSALLLAYSTYLVALLKDYINTNSYANCWWNAYVYYPLINVASTTATAIMVVMTADRCLFVHCPFRARTHMTNKSTRIKIMLSLLTSFVINFPRILWYKPVAITTTAAVNDDDIAVSAATAVASGNLTINDTASPSCCVFYQIGKNQHGKLWAVVITWIHSAVLHCLPLLFLILLNTFLIYKFRVQKNQSIELGMSRTVLSMWDKEQVRLTITYIAIVGLFVLTTMPSAFADENISIALFSADRHSLHIRILQYASNLLMWLNFSSIHFTMYAFINTKFQRAFKLMIRRWWAKLGHYYYYYYCCCCCSCCFSCCCPDESCSSKNRRLGGRYNNSSSNGRSSSYYYSSNSDNDAKKKCTITTSTQSSNVLGKKKKKRKKKEWRGVTNGNNKKTTAFNMDVNEEQVPFNNNKNRLQTQTSNMSTTSQTTSNSNSNSYTVSFRLSSTTDT